MRFAAWTHRPTPSLNLIREEAARLMLHRGTQRMDLEYRGSGVLHRCKPLRVYLTEYTQMVLESQLPHKIVSLLLSITN